MPVKEKGLAKLFYVSTLCALALAVIIIGRPVLVPLAFSLIIAFMLGPVVLGFEKYGLRRLPAVILVVVMVTVVTAGIGVLVTHQLRNLAGELPRHSAQLKEKISSLKVGEKSDFTRLWEMWDEMIATVDQSAAENGGAETVPVEVRSAGESAFVRLTNIVSPALEPLAKTVVVIVLVVFMLLQREDLRNRFLAAVGHTHLAETTRLLNDTTVRLSRYLLSLFAVNASFGIVFAIGLALMGVPYAMLWGLLTTGLRFIPYVGSSASMLFPTVVSLATLPGWTPTFGVLLLFAVLEFFTGNVIEPWLFGHSIGVNPVGVLISIVFWTWAWSGSGLVLAVPLTVVVVSLGKHIPQLRLISILLGDDPPLSNELVLYQRLLAGDAVEASRMYESNARSSLPKGELNLAAIDSWLIPALVLARQEHAAGGLTDADYDKLSATARTSLQPPAMAATMSAASTSTTAAVTPLESVIKPKEATQLPFVLLCISVHDHAEAVLLEAATKSVREFADITFVEAQSIDEDQPLLDWPQKAPHVIVLSVLPSGGLPETLAILKEARRRFPDANVMVGHWNRLQRPHRLRRVLSNTLGKPLYVTSSTLRLSRRIRDEATKFVLITESPAISEKADAELATT